MTNLLSASFLLHATIPEQAPPAHHRQKTLLANISSGQPHPAPGGFRIVFPIYSSQRDFLQRLRQTSTPCTPSPPMSAWHSVSVSQHECALSCAASNAGGFRYTADPLWVGLDQEMMGLFNLARAFVFPALTALSSYYHRNPNYRTRSSICPHRQICSRLCFDYYTAIICSCQSSHSPVSSWTDASPTICIYTMRDFFFVFPFLIVVHNRERFSLRNIAKSPFFWKQRFRNSP